MISPGVAYVQSMSHSKCLETIALLIQRDRGHIILQTLYLTLEFNRQRGFRTERANFGRQ